VTCKVETNRKVNVCNKDKAQNAVKITRQRTHRNTTYANMVNLDVRHERLVFDLPPGNLVSKYASKKRPSDG